MNRRCIPVDVLSRVRWCTFYKKVYGNDCSNDCLEIVERYDLDLLEKMTILNRKSNSMSFVRFQIDSFVKGPFYHIWRSRRSVNNCEVVLTSRSPPDNLRKDIQFTLDDTILDPIHFYFFEINNFSIVHYDLVECWNRFLVWLHELSEISVRSLEIPIDFLNRRFSGSF